MSEPFFFSLTSAPTVGDLAALANAEFDSQFAARRIEGLAALERAGPRDLAYSRQSALRRRAEPRRAPAPACCGPSASHARRKASLR